MPYFAKDVDAAFQGAGTKMYPF
ncbi:hypothetical protein SOVF_002280, partial [Spinacia oleracea]